MSESGTDLRDELRETKKKLRALRRDPGKNVEQIALWESVERHLLEWIESNKPGVVVVQCTNDGMGIPVWVPGLYVNPRSIVPNENPPASARTVLAAIEQFAAKLPDVPGDRGYYPGDDIESHDSMRNRIAPRRWAWSKQRHTTAVAEVGAHVEAGRIGAALLGVWNIAAKYAAFASQVAVNDGARRGKRKADKDRHDQFSAYSRRNESAKKKYGADVHAEVDRRLKNGEDWDVVLEDIEKRPSMPTKKTLATRWVPDLNPHKKPGPRKRIAAPAKQG